MNKSNSCRSMFHRGLTFLLLSILLLVGCDVDHTTLRVAGGPAGGTYQGFAEAIVATVETLHPGQKYQVSASGGSIANLLSVNRQQQDFGLAYAGDAFLGRAGLLPAVHPATKNIRAVCRLYGAAAQLVVPANSRINNLGDLVGARVAIGNPGSGTAVAAERYFTSLGLWDMIIPIYVGFSMGMEELQKNQVSALWMLVGFPNKALSGWFEQYPLRLLPLVAAADNSTFWESYPFYARVKIPAGTYPGQTVGIASFQDSTLLLTGLHVSEQQVYQLLKSLFSQSGRKHMIAIHPLGGEMTLVSGLDGIKIPLHSGADRFWREQGMHKNGD